MANKRRRAAALAELDELYEQVPTIRCKGLCYDSCTVIPASELERQRVAERGFRLLERGVRRAG